MLYAKLTPDAEEAWSMGDSYSSARCQYSTVYAPGFCPLDVISDRPEAGDASDRLVRHFRKVETSDGYRILKDYYIAEPGATLPPDVPAPRRWTRLAIKRALESAGLWETARGLMEAGGKLDDFYLCDYVKEGDEAFTAVYGPACERLGKERVDAFIDGLDVSR